jgi:hypothetical protein
MRQFATLLLIVALSPAPATATAAAQDPAQPPQPEDAPQVEMNEFERKFEKTMSGATLVGRFTIEGQGDGDKPPAEERYVISKVTKIGEDRWLFVARIGEAKVPVPLPLPVKWAGDTPVISVTKVSVPGMGTYSARVLIYDGHYAGTWDAGDHGGHLWGRIERAGAAGKAGAKQAAPKADAPEPETPAQAE